MTTRKWFLAVPATAAAAGIFAVSGASDLVLLVAAALLAWPLALAVERLRARDPHDELVRRIERQMAAHRRAARSKKSGPGNARSRRT